MMKKLIFGMCILLLLISCSSEVIEETVCPVCTTCELPAIKVCDPITIIETEVVYEEKIVEIKKDCNEDRGDWYITQARKDGLDYYKYFMDDNYIECENRLNKRRDNVLTAIGFYQFSNATLKVNTYNKYLQTIEPILNYCVTIKDVEKRRSIEKEYDKLYARYKVITINSNLENNLFKK